MTALASHKPSLGNLPWLVLVFLLPLSGAFGQTTFSKLLDRYEANTAFPREIVYLHLNKSIFIPGEQLAFKAYLWDNTNEHPSSKSRNLYIQIKNQNDSILKEQLVLLTQGVSNGIIKIDSTFKSSTFFTIAAFTNYMRNFKAPYHFQERLLLVDPEDPEAIKALTASAPKLEIIPEAGNYLLGEEATFRIKATTTEGFSAGNLNTTIKDELGNIIYETPLDQFGESQFLLRPQKNKRYFAEVDGGKAFAFPPPEKENPFGLKIYHLKNKLGVHLKTRTTLDKKMFLAIHNGKTVKALDVDFENGESTLIIPKEDLFQGMNIFTLLDEEGTSRIERFYFNFQFSKQETPLMVAAERIAGDSVRVTLRNLGDPMKWNSLSASILPKNTKSYQRNHNILSYTGLIPFTEGQLIQPKRYFADFTPKKAYSLNNMLISLKRPIFWDQAFVFEHKINFPKERGLTLVGYPNNKARNFILNNTYYGNGAAGVVAKNSNTFTIPEVYPLVDEKLVVSEVAKNGKFKKPGLFLRFEPSTLPRFQLPPIASAMFLPKEALRQVEMNTSNFEEYTLQKVIELDEVEVVAQRKAEREEKIRNQNYGRVEFFDDNDPRRNMFLSIYLRQFGFNVSEDSGRVFISNRTPTYPFNTGVAVYLDDFLLYDLSVLYRFTLDIVDYIVVNRSGIGGGPRGGGGVIKIYTDPVRRYRKGKKAFDFGYTVPLGFEPPKTYRRPEYLSYTGQFFTDFGILGWFPDLKLNPNNTLEFTIWNPYLDTFKISLEGIVNNNELFAHEFTVTLPEN
ncbi:MAG: hypothetical protein AAGF96_04470 [Bacteroidota bacterium]